jgi:hypothetical protein
VERSRTESPRDDHNLCLKAERAERFIRRLSRDREVRF